MSSRTKIDIVINFIKHAIMSIIFGAIFYALYILIGRISTLLWIMSLYSIGIWFPVLIYFWAQKKLKHTGDDLSAYIPASILIFVLLIIFQSKNTELLAKERVMTALGLFNVLYLLLFQWFLDLKIYWFDLVFGLLYGLTISYIFIDPQVQMPTDLTLYIAAWLSSLLLHVLIILDRGSKISRVTENNSDTKT